ncbi:PDZ domain containing 1 [Mactra antiquata]
MSLKKWHSLDIFNFSQCDNKTGIMESLSSRFAEISQSHAATLLRNKRLGSLGSVKSNSESEHVNPAKKEDSGDSSNPPMLQRTAIIQKDENGYGLTVSGDNPVYVASIKAGGAAQKAGVQIGDKIIKVNGKHVINANHTEVVHMIRAGSYVALTLLGKPTSSHSSNRESLIERDLPSSYRESQGSFRDSILDKITGPQPVDAEKERDLRQQKLNTIRVMYDAAQEDCEKLRKDFKNNPSDIKLQNQITEKEKTLRILEAQLNTFQGYIPSNTQPPSINVDSEENTSRSSVHSKKERKHVKHSSSPGAMYRSPDQQQRTTVNVSRSKSDVSTRKNALSEYSFGHPGYKRTESSPETASVPATVSDLGSDSPCTSPSTSPTPLQSQNLDIDTVTGDSGIEDGSQNSIVMSYKQASMIIGQDDDEFASDDESTGESKVFSDLKVLETKPAHMAIFLHYVLNQRDPASLLFYQLSHFYSIAQGNTKDLKKWAFEIYSTFIADTAPLKVPSLKSHIVHEIDTILTFRSEKEDQLRSIFHNAREVATDDVQKLLNDLKVKKEKGLIEGSCELQDHMDKNTELKIVEKYLLQDLENCSSRGEDDDKMAAQSWAIATFLRHVGLNKPSSHSNLLERVQSFVSKDKQQSKFKFSGKSRSKNHKGHQFVLIHLYKQEACIHCNKVLWGVGFQGYQCQTCDQFVHRTCIDLLEETCSKKKKPKPVKPKPTPPATPLINDTDQMGSPTSQAIPGVFPQPLKDAEDKEINAFRDGGHSVGNLRNRFENMSPENESPGRKNSDIGRSESMKGRGDVRDRPAKRSNSDLAMDENTLRALNDKSSSNSSLRTLESPMGSMDILPSEVQNDSDFDVESELPSLKQVLGEDTVRKLKPKEKKRQDVINELFYTEQCHVRNLKILDTLFYRPMMKETAIPQEFTKSLFPNLETMIALHGSLNNNMKLKRKEKPVIASVGDILLERFDGEAGENFRNGCAIFCRNQSHTLENLKAKFKKDLKLAQLLADAEQNPLCQRLALKDIIPKQFMRLTKYPLLIENLLKYTPTNTEEHTNLERAQKCSKHILEYVNQAVKDCENHQRLIDLQRKIDKKNIDNTAEMDELREFDLSHHKLIHDGTLTWSLGRKQIELHVILLERAMVVLQKQDDRLVLKLQSTQLVAGKADSSKKHSPLLWLNNVLARNDATDKKAFFVVNTSKSGPQIYKLVAGTVDEQKTWTKHITQASDFMKKNEINLKKKPVTQLQEEIPTVNNALQPGSENGEIQDLDNDPLVQPEDVTFTNPVINPDVQDITPLAGDVVESVEDLSLPIPMERLRDMSNRMNQILTNLLAQTRATGVSTPMSQAAVNSRDEERDRLRKELKFAQEELNRLRRIKQKQMEAEKDKDGVEIDVKSERPVSIVSETSTVSESEVDENKDDLTDEQETVVSEDNMPGIPIEPDLISETENLNEVSPGTMDTLIDNEQALDIAETSGTDLEDSNTFEEDETEIATEELHEVDPAEEDQMEDIETPTVEIIGPDISDGSDDDDNDDDNGDDNVDNDNNNNTSMENNEIDTNDDNNTSVENDNNNDDGGDSVESQDKDDGNVDGNNQLENVIDRLKIDDTASGDSDTNGEKKDNDDGEGEIFQDAVDSKKIDNDNMDITELKEDPGGIVSDSDNKTMDTETVSGENNKPAEDANNETSNNNIELDKNIEMVQQTQNTESASNDSNKDSASETQTDASVTGLGDSSSDQV